MWARWPLTFMLWRAKEFWDDYTCFLYNKCSLAEAPLRDINLGRAARPCRVSFQQRTGLRLAGLLRVARSPSRQPPSLLFTRFPFPLHSAVSQAFRSTWTWAFLRATL